MPRPEKIRLGEILVQQKLLTEEQLQFSLSEQKRTGRKLGKVFVENGFVSGAEIITDDGHNADVGVKRGGNGKVCGGTAEAAFAFAERRFNGINGDRANDNE